MKLLDKKTVKFRLANGEEIKQDFYLVEVFGIVTTLNKEEYNLFKKTWKD